VSSALFPQPRPRTGLTSEEEHIFTWIAVIVVLLYLTAWVGAISDLWRQQAETALEQAIAAEGKATPAPVAPTRQIATSLLDESAPTAAFITDAMMSYFNPLRGLSGKVYFATRTPGSPVVPDAPNGAKGVFIPVDGGAQAVSPVFTAPQEPGMYKLAVQVDQATRALDNFNVISLVPFSEKRGGRIGLYFLGNWPFERGGTPKSPAYANPAGFIEVTPENEDTYVSEHFRLRDFLTKDQYNVWPKYILLNPKLLDKLELTIAELQATGHPVKQLHIMSGFRTPEYNYGGGNTEGRANLSRHMYGDAADVFVDNDGNGMMDDLNHDGRVDVSDAEVILAAVERVERKYPSLVGGVGVYSACCGHGPFTHIDVRGYRARWRGFGNG